MGNFKQYEEAAAKYASGLSIKTAPVFSWDFHQELLKELKDSFLDLNSLMRISSKNHWDCKNFDLRAWLKEEVVIVTDSQLRIVFASKNIVKMNGYDKKEVVGKSPKMFQGVKTNQITSKEIRAAIELQQPFEKTVLNYKKNGETYLCLIKGFPIFDTKGNLSHFIAFEKAA